MDSAIAHQRGEDGIIAIQGALILAQGLNDPAPFQRVLQQLPKNSVKVLPADIRRSDFKLLSCSTTDAIL